MTFKAILFDIDGTLVDSNEQHISAWHDAFQESGRDIDRHTIHEQVGKGGDNLLPALIPGISAEEQDKLGEAHGKAFRGRYREQVRVFPEAKALIERARSDNKKIVLASSASQEELDFWVELLGVAELLTATTCRDDVEHSKPAPDIFSTALDKVAPIQPAQAVVIGDTPYDLSAARKCAIPAIAVRSGGFDDEVLRAAGPIAIYDDVTALLAQYDTSPLAGTA